MEKKSLPKPISARALKKEYEQLAIKTNHTIDSSLEEGKKIIDLMHYYLNCFSNLYGYIDAYLLSDIVDEYEPELFENISFDSFIALLNVISHEKQNYYILNMSDAFDIEDPQDTDLMVVNKELVNSYARIPILRFIRLYDIERCRQERDELDPYLPSEEELAEYEDPTWFKNTVETLNLLNFLNRLRINSNSGVVDYYGNPIAGKKLKNVIFLENYEKKWISETKQEWRRKSIEDDFVIPYPNRIINTIETYIQIDMYGENTSNRLLQTIMDMLEKVDVVLDEALINQLLKLYMSVHNNLNHWPLFGWSPYELASQFYDSNVPRKIAFGENLQKQFESGELDKDEYIRQLEEAGFEVAEEEKMKRS